MRVAAPNRIQRAKRKTRKTRKFLLCPEFICIFRLIEIQFRFRSFFCVISALVNAFVDCCSNPEKTPKYLEKYLCSIYILKSQTKRERIKYSRESEQSADPEQSKAGKTEERTHGKYVRYDCFARAFDRPLWSTNGKPFQFLFSPHIF